MHSCPFYRGLARCGATQAQFRHQSRTHSGCAGCSAHSKPKVESTRHVTLVMHESRINSIPGNQQVWERGG